MQKDADAYQHGQHDPSGYGCYGESRGHRNSLHNALARHERKQDIVGGNNDQDGGIETSILIGASDSCPNGKNDGYNRAN